MNSNGNKLQSQVVDLFMPVNRFGSAARIHVRLHRWWLVLRKYWWLPALIAVATVGPAWLYTAATGPTYESKARLLLTGKLNVSESQIYTEELINFLGTQAALLRSPAIQNRAWAKYQAQYKSGTGPASGGRKMKIPDAARPFWRNLFAARSAPGGHAPPAIPFSIRVDEGSKSSTVDLRVTGAEPVATRRFLDCLLAAFLDYKKESLDQASGQAAASLNAEAAQLKGELEAARAKLHDFEASNNVVFLQQQGAGAETYLATLNRHLATLRTELKLLDSLTPEQWVETDANGGGGASGQAPGDEAAARQTLSGLAESQGALFQADQKMHLLMAERDELARFLRPEHPKIIKLEQDIAAQRQIVQVSREEASKQLTLRRQALALQVRNLETASAEWNAKAVETSRKMANYEQLRQKAQRLQTAHDKTLDLLQNIKVGQRMEQANIGILDPASLAAPTHRLLLNLAMAICIAVLLGFGALYGVALFQDHFASHLELAGELAEPVAGEIPSISLKKFLAPVGRESLERQRFEFLESFRHLRASLMFSGRAGAGPKIVVVASSVPAEGKSTTALYLAATLARANSRVLLIDGDMRRPVLHTHFELPPGPGLAEVLGNEILPAEAILSTGVENLSFLPAGQPSRNPGDLVLSPAWGEFLAWVKSRFDYVLVDTPPVTAADDAAVLAPQADGVLFVVRALSTSARVARSALDRLRHRESRVVGVVFNRAVSSPCEHQYYQQYASAYGWEPARNAAGPERRPAVPGPGERVKLVNGCD